MKELAIPQELVSGSAFIQELIYLLRRHKAIGDSFDIEWDLDTIGRDYEIRFVIPEGGPKTIAVTLEVK